jgi:hypothetical protein
LSILATGQAAFITGGKQRGPNDRRSAAGMARLSGAIKAKPPASTASAVYDATSPAASRTA